jgi:L-fucose isomerase-like protein
MAKIAFVGFGEINSPRDLIEAKCAEALGQVKSLGFDVLTTATVTDDPGGLDVKRAIGDLSSGEFDTLILCIAGWIPSHAVISITSEFKEKPMVLWGLCGDVINGKVVTAAPQAGTTALRKVFEDLGYRFTYIYNIIGLPAPVERIRSFVLASSAARFLTHRKVGMMGYRDMKLYNTLYEGLSLKRSLGIEVEFFEMLEVFREAEKFSDAEVSRILGKIRHEWEFMKPVDEDFLRKGISYYLAVRKIAEENRFHAISLKDVDGMKKLLDFPPAMIFMLLSDEAGLCSIPENDTMGAVTQLIVKELTGQCAAYLEFYEFFETSVLLGVPDFVPAEIVDGKVTVTGAAFGGISGGLLNVSRLKTGKLTLARISNAGRDYTLHICTGEGRLKAWEEAGWDDPAPQLPSLEVFLDVPMDDFTRKISGQHYIMAYGDHSEALRNFCHLKDIGME